jgi:hypothetical protein
VVGVRNSCLDVLNSLPCTVIVQECKLWYGLFAMVSRSRMEAQGVEGAWTVSLESAMRAYVSRGKQPSTTQTYLFSFHSTFFRYFSRTCDIRQLSILSL